MKPTIKEDCRHAYVGKKEQVAVYLWACSLLLCMGRTYPMGHRQSSSTKLRLRTSRSRCWQSSARRFLEALTGSVNADYLSWLGLGWRSPTLTGTLAMTSQRKKAGDSRKSR